MKVVVRPRRLQSDLHKALKAVQESLPPGPRHCLIINKDGSVHRLNKDKHELAEELSIPIRDMRVVDPLVGPFTEHQCRASSTFVRHMTSARHRYPSPTPATSWSGRGPYLSIWKPSA